MGENDKLTKKKVKGGNKYDTSGPKFYQYL